MRPIFVFAFVLFSVNAFAQKSIPIIVIPENETIKKQSNSENKFNKSVEILHDPSLGNINQETISSKMTPGSSPAPKSFSDLADKITSAQVEHFGGEAGALRIRLRGARAFEPSYYFNGIPLTGAGSSEQNVSLLPLSNIGLLNVYPDSPPFWLSSMGISGDIDIQSCRRIDCFTYDQENNVNAFKVTEKIGSYHYNQISGVYSLKPRKNFEIFMTSEYTSSKEDYPIFNSSNSVLNPNQGYFESLQNNDFKKFAASFGLSTFNQSLGKIKFDTVFGNQNKGNPGEIGSFSISRTKKNIFISTLNTQKLFSDSGLQWGNQLGILYNTSDTQNIQSGFAAQANHSENYTLQLKSWFLLPSFILAQEQSGISIELLQANQKTKTLVPSNLSDDYKSSVNANRNDFRLSLFESIVIAVTNKYSLSANMNAWASFSQANSNMDCNYPGASNTCNNKFQEQEKSIYGYTFSLQNKYDFLIHFMRYTLSMRRPYLNEFYGAPEGLLPNINLLPESSKKFETGFRTLFGEIGYFHANDNNLIFLQQTSSNTFQYQNIENGYRDGFYLNSDYYIFDFWKVYFSYQYLISKMILENEESFVPRSAKHYINTGTNVENILLGHVIGYQALFGAYFNMNWQSPFYLDYANINEMDVPPLYNAGISYTLSNKLNSQNYTISFDIYNILDETYSSVSNSTGFIQQMQTNGYIGYPPPGRRFYISLIGEF